MNKMASGHQHQPWSNACLSSFSKFLAEPSIKGRESTTPGELCYIISCRSEQCKTEGWQDILATLHQYNPAGLHKQSITYQCITRNFSVAHTIKHTTSTSWSMFTPRKPCSFLEWTDYTWKGNGAYIFTSQYFFSCLLLVMVDQELLWLTTNYHSQKP